MKLKKFFIRTVLAVSLLNFMNVNLTFAQVPSKQALVQTKEAKIKLNISVKWIIQVILIKIWIKKEKLQY